MVLCIDHKYDVEDQSGLQRIVQDCCICYKIVNDCAFKSELVVHNLGSHCLILIRMMNACMTKVLYK